MNGLHKEGVDFLKNRLEAKLMDIRNAETMAEVHCQSAAAIECANIASEMGAITAREWNDYFVKRRNLITQRLDDFYPLVARHGTL